MKYVKSSLLRCVILIRTLRCLAPASVYARWVEMSWTLQLQHYYTGLFILHNHKTLQYCTAQQFTSIYLMVHFLQIMLSVFHIIYSHISLICSVKEHFKFLTRKYDKNPRTNVTTNNSIGPKNLTALANTVASEQWLVTTEWLVLCQFSGRMKLNIT